MWRYDPGALPTVIDALPVGLILATYGPHQASDLIDAATGKVRWHFDAPISLTTSVASSEADVIAYEGGPSGPSEMVALEAATGQVRWRADLASVAQGQPILLGSEVIAVEFPAGVGQLGHLAGYGLADATRRWTAPIPTDPVGWAVTPKLIVVQAADPVCTSAS